MSDYILKAEIQSSPKIVKFDNSFIEMYSFKLGMAGPQYNI